jgi:hypothetical protein
MDSASPAKSFAAPEFGAGELEFIPEVPQQRHVRVAVELAAHSIDFEGNHGFWDCANAAS